MRLSVRTSLLQSSNIFPHDVPRYVNAAVSSLPTTEAIKAGGDRRLEKAPLDEANVNAKYYVINSRRL